MSPDRESTDSHSWLYDAYLERALVGDAEAPAAYIERHAITSPDLVASIEALHAAMRGDEDDDTVARPTPRLDAAPDLPIAQVGAFRVIRPIGRGGMGLVFLAEQEPLGRLVALKIILPQFRLSPTVAERFGREARAVARLDHPNIVRIHGSGIHEGVHYIAMALVPGRGLDEIAKEAEAQGQTIPSATVIPWAIALADALQTAHDAGLLHRDVKPSNIRITPGGDAVLLDFGLARETSTEDQTLTESFVGTPAYAAPEQIAGVISGLDGRADVYALGATLFRCLTGTPPFEGQTQVHLLHQILTEDPPPPRQLNPAISRDLETILLTALAKDPDRRYATAEALKADLEALRAFRPIVARPPTRPERLAKWVRRNQAAAIGVGAVLAISLTATIVTSILWLRAERHAAEVVALGRENVARLAAFRRMSDVKLLDQLQSRVTDLWPAHVGRVPAMRSWLVEARELADRRGVHEARLEELRAEGSLDRSLEWQRDVLAELVQGLSVLRQRTIPRIEERVRLAGRTHTQSIVDAADAWARAQQGVAKSPHYGGLVLAPQEGLIPIGPDPVTGLWEFAVVGTGEVPRRAPDGRLPWLDTDALVLVLVPGGQFDMGTRKPTAEHPRGQPNVDIYTASKEQPVHPVDLAPFLIAKAEMTQGQWRALTGADPSKWRVGTTPAGRAVTPRHPVEQVSWEDCTDVLRRIGLGLPTEAQWEYAARAGTTQTWWTGEARRSLIGAANLADQTYRKAGGKVTAEPWEDGWSVHGPVALLRPNPFGLHDVVGNVLEWCQDRYDPAAYGRARRAGDGLAQTERTENVIVRGGCWINTADMARSGYRGPQTPAARVSTTGVRPARPIR